MAKPITKDFRAFYMERGSRWRAGGTYRSRPGCLGLWCRDLRPLRRRGGRLGFAKISMNEIRQRVVVNATPLLRNLTGVGQVVLEISKRLSVRPDRPVDFFTPFKTFPSIGPILKGDSKLWACRLAARAARHLPWKEQLRRRCADRQAGAAPYDLYWEPNYIPLDSIPAKRVVTTVYDMSVFDHPEWHPPDRTAWFRDHFFEKIGRSDWITTISEFSKERFLALQDQIPADRVRVIPCGINHEVFRVMDPGEVDAFRRRQGLPERFILFVGTVEPRKNLLHLLRAYELLPIACRELCPLVLAGDTGWRNQEILKHIRRLGASVIRVGYVKNQQDLARMYNAASLFVFPSLYEGFGIPPLEAMACGTPVCLSSIPVFHEIYGQENSFFGDPFDADAFSGALYQSLTDSENRSRFRDQGLHLAQNYTWDAAFEGYRDLFTAE